MNKYEQIKGMANPNRGSLGVQEARPPQRTEQPAPVQQQPAQQEPVEVDQATMKLAESVGLIGPTSRTHDLHQAIQRFHDLICANATVKAAQMAADVIRECTQPQRKPLTDAQIKEIANNSYSPYQSAVISFAREIEAAHGIKEKNT
jgi:hypothetical protein